MRSAHGRTAFGLVGILMAAFLSLPVNVSARSGYTQINLVSDVPGATAITDTNLVNPWGIAITGTGRIWVSDNGTGVSTIYMPDGTPLSLVVTIPPPAGGTAPSAPTGVVLNNTGAFAVTSGTNSASSIFLFVTEDGTIAGWNPTVNPTVAVIAVDNSASEAIYKGLAVARDASSNAFLYAANFHAGVVEKYDANFGLVSSFTDTSLPAGYAPFNVANIGGRLFVTFALQDADAEDDVAGPGNGFVDVFDLDGNLVQNFAANGTLNAPWGLAQAPGNFGRFSHALLVGNFGDGRISAFDPDSGALLGQLKDHRGRPIEIEGLWGLAFFSPPRLARNNDQGDNDDQGEDGMDDNGDQPTSRPRLYFTAGPEDESHGLFGFLKATPPIVRHGRH